MEMDIDGSMSDDATESDQTKWQDVPSEYRALLSFVVAVFQRTMFTNGHWKHSLFSLVLSTWAQVLRLRTSEFRPSENRDTTKRAKFDNAGLGSSNPDSGHEAHFLSLHGDHIS